MTQWILQFSNAGNLIIQECKQILVSMRYRVRSNLSLELLCMSMFLELFQSIHDWFLEWFNYPKGLSSNDTNCFITLSKDENHETLHITNYELAGWRLFITLLFVYLWEKRYTDIFWIFCRESLWLSKQREKFRLIKSKSKIFIQPRALKKDIQSNMHWLINYGKVQGVAAAELNDILQSRYDNQETGPT